MEPDVVLALPKTLLFVGTCDGLIVSAGGEGSAQARLGGPGLTELTLSNFMDVQGTLIRVF